MFSAPTPTVARRNRNRFRSEKKELRDFLNEIEDDDVVYDIGANTGLYTLFSAKACPGGEVIAFEPYPPNLGLLKQDVALNHLQNVRLVDIALSDSTGSIEFNQPDEDDVGYGSSAIQSKKSETTIEVATTTGDKLIADGEIPSPNVIKIDVEGSEPLVLEGLKKALSAPSCRAVFCEVHLQGADRRPSVQDFGSSPEDIQAQLEEFGFTLEKVDYRENSQMIYKGHK